MTKELDKFLLDQKRLLDEKLKIIQDKSLSSLTSSNPDSANIQDDVEKASSFSEAILCGNAAGVDSQTLQENISSQESGENVLTQEVKVEQEDSSINSLADDQLRESAGSGVITVSEDDESDNESANTAQWAPNSQEETKE